MASDIYNSGKSTVDNAANTGNNAVGSFDPNAWASNTQGGLKDIWNQQGTTQNNYMSAYKNAISSNPSATDLYNTANTQFNVQPLQNTANQLNNAVLQAPISNVNAAKGFNYDNNQVQQKTAQDLQYLTPQANAAQNNANTAQNNAANYVTQGMAQNNMNLLPIQQQGQYLMDSYARQQSGFTSTAQSQLQSLQDKMDQGVQLSASEMQAYSALAAAESSYQGSLATANATIKSAQLNNQYQRTGQGDTLTNTFTGGIANPGILAANGAYKPH